MAKTPDIGERVQLAFRVTRETKVQMQAEARRMGMTLNGFLLYLFLTRDTQQGRAMHALRVVQGVPTRVLMKLEDGTLGALLKEYKRQIEE